jgi:uncharacterized protein (TIGR00255 family)
MNSMTGFGTSQLKNRQLEIEVHVKSVNGRFLEVRFHLPKEYSPYENDFRKAFSGRWLRGTVDVYIHRRPGAHVRLQTVHVRKENARHWTTELKKLARELNVAADLSLRDILQMPYVMEHQDRLSLLPGELKLVEAQISKAAERCRLAREREGGVLKKELLQQIKNLESAISDMESCREDANKQAGQRLKSRLATINDIGSSGRTEAIDGQRLALETALIMDKMDVHEEIIRLKEHAKACRILVQSAAGEGHGKKLDFYCQELLREVNTIGSKSQFASLTQIVVVAKSVIEKFREQVQNIE